MSPERRWVGVTLAMALVAGCGDNSTGPVVPASGDREASAGEPSGKGAVPTKGMRAGAPASDPSASVP
jgi:hypothetical protein